MIHGTELTVNSLSNIFLVSSIITTLYIAKSKLQLIEPEAVVYLIDVIVYCLIVKHDTKQDLI